MCQLLSEDLAYDECNNVVLHDIHLRHDFSFIEMLLDFFIASGFGVGHVFNQFLEFYPKVEEIIALRNHILDP